MTYYNGAWTYADLIQAWDAPPDWHKPAPFVPSPNSIMGKLSSNPEFTIFTYLIGCVPGMDRKLGDPQFQSTLFVCSDTDLRKKFTDDFFMRFDINAARRILNYSTLTRRVDMNSLLSRTASKIDTKDRSNQINLFNLNGVLYADSHKILSDEPLENGNLVHVAGLLMPFDFSV